MKIYIDGDGCPVKSTIFEIAADFFIEVILVTSFDHYSKQELPANVQTIYVDSGMDAADFRILTLLSAGDVLVTQDYGLASLAIGKGVRIIHHTGFEYTKNNIENLMQTRYLSAIERKNGKHTKGPRAFTDEKKEIFRASFLDLMKSIKKPEKSNDQL